MADLLFDHDVGLGMEIVRFNFGASSTNESFVRSMRPFGAMPCLMLQDGTYNWTLVGTCCCLMHLTIGIALPAQTAASFATADELPPAVPPAFCTVPVLGHPVFVTMSTPLST